MIDMLQQAYGFLAKGGPAMVVLGLGSIFCVAYIIERLAALQRKKVIPPRFMEDLEKLAEGKKVSEALAVCRTGDNAVARIVAAGLTKLEKGLTQAREAMEIAGRREVSNLEKNLDSLSTLAAAGPLVGLLGTVTGMIRTFDVVKAFGVGDPMRLSGGISEALISTAAGLVLAIPALVFHRYFMRKIDRLVLEIEEYTERVLQLFLEGK